VDSTANVFNKILSTNSDPHLTNILLLIIVIFLCAYILYKACILHNNCITKGPQDKLTIYIRSKLPNAQTIVIKIYSKTNIYICKKKIRTKIYKKNEIIKIKENN